MYHIRVLYNPIYSTRKFPKKVVDKENVLSPRQHIFQTTKKPGPYTKTIHMIEVNRIRVRFASGISMCMTCMHVIHYLLLSSSQSYLLISKVYVWSNFPFFTVPLPFAVIGWQVLLVLFVVIFADIVHNSCYSTFDDENDILKHGGAVTPIKPANFSLSRRRACIQHRMLLQCVVVLDFGRTRCRWCGEVKNARVLRSHDTQSIR